MYLPRLSRLHSYILVTYKFDLNFLRANKLLVGTDKFLSSYESSFKATVDDAFVKANNVFLPINNYFSRINCNDQVLNNYSRKRLQGLVSPNQKLERLCVSQLQLSFKSEKAKLKQIELEALGINSEGKIRLLPADKVLLAGDSLMQGPAAVLVKSFKDKGIIPINKSKISTGLSYPQFFDWPLTIKNIVEKENVNSVVVFLGANDTFNIYDGAKVYPVGTDEWLKVYQKRVTSIAEHLRAQNVTLIWLGMPAMNRSDIQPYVSKMNSIFRDVVTKYDGIYIDSAKVLGGNESRFNSFLLEKNRRVIVRTEDGVHFTPAGWSILSDSILDRFQV